MAPVCEGTRWWTERHQPLGLLRRRSRWQVGISLDES